MALAYEVLKGTDKVAVMMQVLDKDTVTRLLKLMDESEVRQISQKMAIAALVDQKAISKIIDEFH
jgi:flagellar motor switch protein FliG